MLGANSATSATFFFITDHRSVDRTEVAVGESGAPSTTGFVEAFAYRAPSERPPPRRAGRRR